MTSSRSDTSGDLCCCVAANDVLLFRPVNKLVVLRVVVVDDEATIEAMKLVFERMKIVIEPSAAVPLGALLGGKLSPDGQKIGLILSGGNIDLTSFFKTLG